jgi:hypothetical protein
VNLRQVYLKIARNLLLVSCLAGLFSKEVVRQHRRPKGKYSKIYRDSPSMREATAALGVFHGVIGYRICEGTPPHVVNTVQTSIGRAGIKRYLRDNIDQQFVRWLTFHRTSHSRRSTRFKTCSSRGYRELKGGGSCLWRVRPKGSNPPGGRTERAKEWLGSDMFGAK